MNRANLSQEDLIYEYLSIVRMESRQRSGIMEEYLRSISNLNNNIYHILTSLNQNYEPTRNRAQSPISSRIDRYSRINTRESNLYNPLTRSSNYNTNENNTYFSNTTFPNTTFSQEATLPRTTFPRTTFPTTFSNNTFSDTTFPTTTLPTTSTATTTLPTTRDASTTFSSILSNNILPNSISRPRTRRSRISRRFRNTTSNTNNIFRNLLQTTLYTPTRPIPASENDISNNTSVHTWRDISNVTDQSICPITQEDLLSTDTVRRIDGCGHVFHDAALRRYLINFDHRCPICRYDMRIRDIESGENVNTARPLFPPGMGYDIRGTIISETDISGTDISGTDISGIDISGIDISGTDISRNTTNNVIGSSPFDFSFDNSFVSSLANNLTSNLNNSFRDLSNIEFTTNYDISNNEFNNAVNLMSSALLSGISEAMNNPDLSGNTITAEYSVFVPPPRRSHED